MLRMGWHRLALASGCAAVVLGTERPAAAQTRPADGTYVTVSGLADVKRYSGDPTTNTLDGSAAGISIAFGTSIAPRWDLEIAADVPARTTALESRSVTLGRTMFALQLRTQNRTVSVATLVRFRGAARGRVQLGYLAGLSILRLHRDFDSSAPAGTPASLIPRSHASVDYGAAPTVGIDAQVAVVSHLSIVPGLLVSAFDLHDVSGGVLLRPRIGVRWTF